jgi:hypothetical protein
MGPPLPDGLGPVMAPPAPLVTGASKAASASARPHQPRWWFICPRTGRRATKLHLPDGALTFASRQAYRLVYACQREPAHYRALRRAFKLRGKLGGTGGIESYIPKPKWMREATYDRKLEEIFAAEEIVDAYTQDLDRKLMKLRLIKNG